jgi:hypothetical protein
MDLEFIPIWNAEHRLASIYNRARTFVLLSMSGECSLREAWEYAKW